MGDIQGKWKKYMGELLIWEGNRKREEEEEEEEDK